VVCHNDEYPSRNARTRARQRRFRGFQRRAEPCGDLGHAQPLYVFPLEHVAVAARQVIQDELNGAGDLGAFERALGTVAAG
jgi:hypothetical protein